MQLVETRAEAEFRTELRAWLADTLPSLPPAPDRDDWPARRAFDTAWQRRLFDAGYAGIAWPAEYGGRGASPSEELIFLSETERAGAPCVGCNFVGTLHAGPTITAEGTVDQKARYLSGILRGEDVWCQGFSEPGSGSDLASLRTRAVRDGDSFVVLGHKIWTSHAQVADFCELLVRTDPDHPRHGGISWLIMPMDLPGIEIQPLRTITGVSEFNEVFLDEVRIPVENLVGAENDGWRARQHLLDEEVAHDPEAARELREEPLRIELAPERDRRHLHARHPSVGAISECTHRLRGEVGAQCVDQPIGLVWREPKLGLANLEAPAVGAQPVERERRVAPAAGHDARAGR